MVLEEQFTVLFDKRDEAATVAMFNTLKHVCELDQVSGAAFEEITGDVSSDIKTSLKAVFDIVAGDTQEVELRLNPRLRDAEATPTERPSQRADSIFFSPSKALVNMASGWSDSDNDLGQGDVQARHAPVVAEGAGKKRKLERHFLDRGVWQHIGILSQDKIGNGLFCDFFPLLHGWP